MSEEELIEKLANIEHRQWMQWANTLLETEPNLTTRRSERWRELMRPYDELPEEWKDYDRYWARKVLREINISTEDTHQRGVIEGMERSWPAIHFALDFIDQMKDQLPNVPIPAEYDDFKDKAEAIRAEIEKLKNDLPN